MIHDLRIPWLPVGIVPDAFALVVVFLNCFDGVYTQRIALCRPSLTLLT